jgi:hypothetical protein
VTNFFNSVQAKWVLAAIALLFTILGVIGILIFTGFTSSFGVGLLAALAATAVGLLAGLLFGVPKAVSSGQIRQGEQLKQVQLETLHSTLKPDAFVQPQKSQSSTDSQSGASASKYTTSTNLAEVSDWLTKLLLGAGLVSLTRLGAPIGHLIDSVAAGLSSGSSDSGSAKAVAGAILFGPAAMGFLDGYILTTLWYQRELGKEE